jgi:hypothetical protein
MNGAALGLPSERSLLGTAFGCAFMLHGICVFEETLTADFALASSSVKAEARSNEVSLSAFPLASLNVAFPSAARLLSLPTWRFSFRDP